MDIKNLQELEALKRKDLQALAKENGIKANQSNAAIIEELQAILFSEAKEVENPSSEPSEEVYQSVSEAVEPIAVPTSEVFAETVVDATTELAVGDEVEALIYDMWTDVTIKRVNKNSYRVVTVNDIEFTVKFAFVRPLAKAISPILAAPAIVEAPATSSEPEVVADIVVEEPAIESVAEETDIELPAEEEEVVDNDQCEEMEEEENPLEITVLSCIEDSLQEFTVRRLTCGKDDLEFLDEEEPVVDQQEDAEDAEDVDTEPEEAGEEEEEMVVEEVEEVQSAQTIVAPTVTIAEPAAVEPAVKRAKFVEAANPFQKLTVKTPSKGTTNKVTWNSGHKAPASSRSSVAVSGAHHSAAKTPKSAFTGRATIHGKAITPAIAAVAKTPTSAAVPAFKATPAPSSTSTAPALGPKMTKAQQKRTEAVQSKIATQQQNEDKASSSSFTFKSHTSAAINAVKPAIAASVKTPASTAVTAHKSATSAARASILTAGSAKRKLNTAFGSTATAGSNITAHLDALPAAANTAAEEKAPAPAPTTAKKSSAPDFARLHSLQFSNSKPISSMVHRNKSIGVKMTKVFEEEMAGTGTSAIPSAAAATPAAPLTAKKLPLSSRAVSVSRARPSVTPASSSSAHRSSSVTLSSSRASSATTLFTAAKTPVKSAVAKTPVKSAASAAVVDDKENILGSANKFVSQRRASNFGKLSSARSAEIKREDRRNTFIEGSAEKRRLSANKARTAAVAKMDTVMESPGPFSALMSPCEY